jgi:acetyl-CoA carboxylase biotin carboxylase subunit
MFRKILIANRGEIAVRIIGTCRRLGIRTVAVFSGADQDSLHVRMADEAYMIGAPPAARSYLDQDAVIRAAREAKAEAIHPGYGFLSENPVFAALVGAHGMKFIGPSADAIRCLGDKVNARTIAIKNGVPVIPGTKGVVRSAGEARAKARRIGYPILIKASAGGGGKGMRVVRTDGDLAGAVDAAMGEAKAAFGSSEVFFERFIEGARHVEIQILADEHGNCVHFGERECSVQRRHQKIIEETPSVVVTPEMRSRMGEAAKRLVLAAGYANAGTVEFIVDGNNDFYFLEVNTRLQVEHPITEMCNGVDLVALQLEASAGERLAIDQESVAPEGAAIECRICAEDPSRDYAPSSGRVEKLTFPNNPGLRIDTFLYEGCEVPIFYDSLLAKMISHGKNRAEAIQRMKHALDHTKIEGVETNRKLCRYVLGREEFVSGAYDTSLLQSIPFNEELYGAYATRTADKVGTHIFDGTYHTD